MTAETPLGPLCSICTEYEAIGSLMNLQDYTTTRFCAMCGVTFLATILEALSGADTTPDVEPAEPAGIDGDAIERQEMAELAAADVAAEQDAAAELPAFPGTASVVRSTHGHRGSRSETSDAQ